MEFAALVCLEVGFFLQDLAMEDERELEVVVSESQEELRSPVQLHNEEGRVANLSEEHDVELVV